jgi:hypothetical protein
VGQKEILAPPGAGTRRHTGLITKIDKHFLVPPDSSVWAYYSRLGPHSMKVKLKSHASDTAHFPYFLAECQGERNDIKNKAVNYS